MIGNEQEESHNKVKTKRTTKINTKDKKTWDNISEHNQTTEVTKDFKLHTIKRKGQRNGMLPITVEINSIKH